ncbi:aa3-type cytochrome c oxidase subunit IV [Brevundimonas sp.]|uniref:aa3-type cytochrome c oxidase subunit IV n=1 Tax=Brevundimonas sp. TaxID=1871086 RepID=UPI002D408477|nr:aa3-type cytochrome c oxidase subunit IV [Brevundimonas sp.]HYD27352.1 aa3-type cytochrome c oxidase subunit IV [Brevundimonas sp.]
MADPHHASDAHDDYVRGSQQIDEQSATFTLFINLAKWGSLLTAATLSFLVLWFQPGGSFIGGAIAALVLLVAGGLYLRSGKKKSH